MSFLLSGIAGSGSQEEGASLTWTGHTTGEGEREINTTTGHTCLSLTERRESETKGGTTASTQRQPARTATVTHISVYHFTCPHP